MFAFPTPPSFGEGGIWRCLCDTANIVSGRTLAQDAWYSVALILVFLYLSAHESTPYDRLVLLSYTAITKIDRRS